MNLFGKPSSQNLITKNYIFTLEEQRYITSSRYYIKTDRPNRPRVAATNANRYILIEYSNITTRLSRYADILYTSPADLRQVYINRAAKNSLGGRKKVATA